MSCITRGERPARASPDVVDARAVGGPEPVHGEEVMAWLRLRDGAEPRTAEPLRESCAGRIARHRNSAPSTWSTSSP
ncbi:AMP-binding enzyme [Kocuria oceani]|uniref:AMP-binding enzyme n=1 Tax=Kocuria oceani TaxID=988827 RepID=UPI004036D79F